MTDEKAAAQCSTARASQSLGIKFSYTQRSHFKGMWTTKQAPTRTALSHLILGSPRKPLPRLRLSASCAMESMEPVVRTYSSSSSPDHNFYHYDSARWLWNEDKLLQERYREFNVTELQAAAVNTAGAQRCMSMVKFWGGGDFNKAFRLTMDNGTTVIARIPQPNAGPARWTTASEVATTDFVRTVLDLPVPKVIAWSTDAHNPVQAEYIIMEEAVGEPLSKVRNELELRELGTVVDNVVRFQKRMLSSIFTQYGALYHGDNAPDGSIGCVIRGDSLPEETKADVSARFMIGPTCTEDFWSKGCSHLKASKGPWESCQSYLDSIADRQTAWLEQNATLPPLRSTQSGLPLHLDDEVVSFQDNVDTHFTLYEQFRKVAAHFHKLDPAFLQPVLWHHDLNPRNIFVKDGRVTSVIDWQHIWAQPLGLVASPPMAFELNGPERLHLPDDFSQMEDWPGKAAIKHQVQQSIMRWVYHSEVRKEAPVLAACYKWPMQETLQQLVASAGDTSTDAGAVYLRWSLMNCSKNWRHIDPDTSCPFEYTQADERLGTLVQKALESREDFWHELLQYVKPDGWTTHAAYVEAVLIARRLREKGLAGLEGKERDHFKEVTTWVEDLD